MKEEYFRFMEDPHEYFLIILSLVQAYVFYRWSAHKSQEKGDDESTKHFIYLKDGVVSAIQMYIKDDYHHEKFFVLLQNQIKDVGMHDPIKNILDEVMKTQGSAQNFDNIIYLKDHRT